MSEGWDADSPFPWYSRDDARLFKIFHPYAFTDIATAWNNKTKFAHYTNAETALKIIRKPKIWLRRASALNDFKEVEHGLELLRVTITDGREHFESVLDNLHPGLSSFVEFMLDDEWGPKAQEHTYIACFSEHGGSHPDEDRYGRLSMWRAYGSGSGVALVFHGDVFHNGAPKLKVVASPVAYLDQPSFRTAFEVVLSNIQANAAFLKNYDAEQIRSLLRNMFRFAIVCTKHPGFREEREWRLIYNPAIEASVHIGEEVHSIRGTPQIIKIIDLLNLPAEIAGINLNSTLASVIIGPTQYPRQMRDAFLVELQAAGVEDAAKRIVVSDVPLRQYD